MTDPNQLAAEVREKMGYAPLPDPSVIQGFGEGEPPPPAFPERPPVDLSQVPDGPAEYIDDEEPESPLIPRPPAAPAPIIPHAPDLAVAGNDTGTSIASYLGREVVLTDKEATAVRLVVLRALQRQVKAQVAEVEALLPKRKRRTRVAKVLATEVTPPETGGAPRKRRGRPPTKGKGGA